MALPLLFSLFSAMERPCLRSGRGPRLDACAVVCLAALASAPAWAASKALVAAIGDAAPGGGLFAGPSFTGWPAAAGTGWIAFRGEVSQGGTSEALIVAHRTPPATRVQVASIGLTAPGGGTFKQFVGRPAVNANGDVAFLALLTRGDDDDDDPTGPTPAGVFLFRHGELRAVARSGETISGAGRLDLVGPIGQTTDPGEDTPERSPSINDAGDVAFLGAVRDNPQSAAALFLAPAEAAAAVVLRLGDAYDGGVFTALGSPALNNTQVLAFHARATTVDPNDDDGVVDGIFSYAGGATVMVRDGIRPMGVASPLRDFGDAVAVNDRGDVAFLAGPLFDDDDSSADDERFGILVCRGGVVIPIAGSGRVVGSDRIIGIRLGAGSGSQLTAPAIAPDGSVAFFATVRGDTGGGEAIVVWNGTKSTAVVYTNGSRADTTPAGGTYNGAESAPAIDANGAVVFLARIAAGASSEAVVYQPKTGEGVPVVVGDAAPSGGFFAGRPFSNPLLNDQGDVVFRAFVARSVASVGIFRYRQGELEAVVRAGDPSPLPDGTPFDDILGQPSVNAEGAVAFSAHILDRGVGIFVADVSGVRTVALVGDPAPGESGTEFRSFGLNPSINDDGAVAFRATTLLRAPDGSVRRERILLADQSGIRILASAGDMNPTGVPFLRLRDPVLSNVPSVAFRASLGEEKVVAGGLFLVDDGGVVRIAVEKDDLGGGVLLSGFTGEPVINALGDLAFLASRSRVSGGLRRSLGPAILRHATSQLASVIAQDMPGPAGGTFRTLGQPAINGLGHLAFRGSFLPLTGGTPGLFLETQDGIEPYLAIGEATALKGRIAQISSRPALNSDGDMAFTAAVSGGTARSGIFLASRTSLEVQSLAVRLGRRGRDRVKLRLLLRTGRTSTGLDPTHEAVTVSLADAKGSLWSVTVPAGTLKRKGKGKTLIATPRRGSSLALSLRTLRLEVPQPEVARVTATSTTVDLTRGGERPLEAPFTVTLQINDDSGLRIAPCELRKRGVRCKVL